MLLERERKITREREREREREKERKRERRKRMRERVNLYYLDTCSINKKRFWKHQKKNDINQYDASIWPYFQPLLVNIIFKYLLKKITAF